MTSKCRSVNNIYYNYIKHRVQLKERLFTFPGTVYRYIIIYA